MEDTTKRRYKPCLLVVLKTAKGFVKPWSILIDSGASSYYVRSRYFYGSQQYAEALKAQEGDSITVRLAAKVCVIISTVLLNLGLQVLGFHSV